MARVIFLSVLAILTVQLVYGQPITRLEAQPESAVEATLELFGTYPAVGIGEVHALKELGDFYVKLIQHPAFAQDVGNVVFEFGNAFFQSTVDRYLAGEDVAYSLRLKKPGRRPLLRVALMKSRLCTDNFIKP